MSDEVASWLRYADENARVAGLCLANDLFSPCIQNAQQAVEKALKARCLALGLPLRRTHSIGGLQADLRSAGQSCTLDDDDCALLDSVYLPSKYPLGSVLPDFEPDRAIAARCLAMADSVVEEAFATLASLAPERLGLGPQGAG